MSKFFQVDPPTCPDKTPGEGLAAFLIANEAYMTVAIAIFASILCGPLDFLFYASIPLTFAFADPAGDVAGPCQCTHTGDLLAETNMHAAGECKRTHPPTTLLAWVRPYHDWRRG